jgi:hypothetical protein
MRAGRQSVFVLLVGIAFYPACGSKTLGTTTQCDGIAIVTPIITITDAATGQPICDATVTAQCGDAMDTLVAYGPDDYPTDASIQGCHYGPGLQFGCESAVSIAKAGYQTISVPNVEVRNSRSCPGPVPEAQQVSVSLKPE